MALSNQPYFIVRNVGALNMKLLGRCEIVPGDQFDLYQKNLEFKISLTNEIKDSLRDGELRLFIESGNLQVISASSDFDPVIGSGSGTSVKNKIVDMFKQDVSLTDLIGLSVPLTAGVWEIEASILTVTADISHRLKTTISASSPIEITTKIQCKDSYSQNSSYYSLLDSLPAETSTRSPNGLSRSVKFQTIVQNSSTISIGFVNTFNSGTAIVSAGSFLSATFVRN